MASPTYAEVETFGVAWPRNEMNEPLAGSYRYPSASTLVLSSFYMENRVVQRQGSSRSWEQQHTAYGAQF